MPDAGWNYSQSTKDDEKYEHDYQYTDSYLRWEAEERFPRENDSDKLNYFPLRTDRRQYRILRLAPGGDDDPIEVRLEAVDVDKIVPPRYEALSYCWGTDRGSHSVRCTDSGARDRTVAITRNLYLALHHFRLKDRPRKLWIDAICIDQSSLEERAEQVGLMAFIYMSAQSVLVWLGPGDAHTPKAIAFASRLEKHATAEDTDEELRRLSEGRELERVPEAAWLAEKITAEEVSAAASFLQNPWWQRAWTQQELALASQSEFHCGESVVSEHTLWVMAHPLDDPSAEFQQRYPGLEDLQRHAESAGSIFTFKMQVPGMEENNPLYCLETMCSRQATEERDKVFATLGMVSGKFKYQVGKPTYEGPIEKVFERVAQALLATLRCPFDIFRYAKCDSVAREGGLPSWIPDWRLPQPSTILSGWSDPESEPILILDGRSEPEFEYPDIINSRFGSQCIENRAKRREAPNHFPQLPPSSLSVRGVTVSRIARCVHWPGDAALRDDLTRVLESLPAPSRAETIYWQVPKLYNPHRLWDCPSKGWPSEHTQRLLRDLRELVAATDTAERDSLALALTVSRPRPIFQQWARAWTALAEDPDGFAEHVGSGGVGVQGAARTFVDALRQAKPMVVGVTDDGRVVGAPDGARVGDVLAVFQGARFPHLLRPATDDRDGRYYLLGECFSYGLAHGEATGLRLPARDIVLI